jgi:hypothetical protein
VAADGAHDLFDGLAADAEDEAVAEGTGRLHQARVPGERCGRD